MTTARDFITRQLGTAGWAPIHHDMAMFLDPGVASAHRAFAIDQRNPENLANVFRAALYQAQVGGFGLVPILARSPLFLAERIQFLGFAASDVVEFGAGTPAARPQIIPKPEPTTSDALALLNADVVTKEPPRPCKVCGNIGGGVACLAAARRELDGAPRSYEPDTQFPRRCLSYVPPRADRDEILGRDSRDGRKLWPEVAAVAALQVQADSAIGKAVALLANMLKDGPRDTGEILAAAEGSSISERTLQRAADQLGAVKTKAGFSGGWTWAMP